MSKSIIKWKKYFIPWLIVGKDFKIMENCYKFTTQDRIVDINKNVCRYLLAYEIIQ